MAKPTVMSDQDVVTKVTAKATEAVGWYDSRLSRERQRTLGYYNGDYPKQTSTGNSSFVSTDVYDAVEMMKAQLLEVFSGGEEIVRFDPTQQMDTAACTVATSYAHWCIFRSNEGFRLFEDVIHDALMARVGVAMVYWDERFEYRDEEFEGLEPHEAMGLASQDDVDSFDSDLDEGSGTYKGTLSRKIDCSKIVIEIVPPEEFLIAPRSKSIKLAPYVGRRMLKAKSELIAEGYPEKLVNSLHYDDGKDIQLSPEALERNKPIETAMALNNPVEEHQEQVTVYESYVRMQIDSSKGTRLYKITHCAQVMLDKEEVDRAPFIAFVPLPIPHLFQGNNYAARVIPYQNARTVLTRGVLDHTGVTTNPRWMIVKGGLINPREMIENRMGGLVNVRTADSIAPLQYPTLNPFVFEILGMLDDNKQHSTGISSLSQGLNKDAISTQNSQGLVDQLVTLSAQRQKIIARNFAYGFLVPLMLEIIRLAVLHEKPGKMIEVAGMPLQVNPKAWTDKTTCTVSLHLGYGERDQAVNQMQAAYAGMAQDPGLQRMFGEPQRYAMATDIMKLRRWGNASKYLANPATLPPPQPPQPDPIAVMEAQAKNTTAQAAQMAAQTHAEAVQAKNVEGAFKLHQSQQKLMVDATNKAREEDRKDFDTVNKIAIAHQDQALAEKTANRKAYVSTKG